MPRPLKIDFYRSEDLQGNELDISGFINNTFTLAVGQRLVDFGDSFLLLHNVRRRGGLILGEMMKGKMTDLPDKVNRTTGTSTDLGLRADEGVGRHAHFLYDPPRRVLLLQRDREVRHPTFTAGVREPIHAEFVLSLIFKQNVLDRLEHMQVIRKISFKVARPENPEAFREIDPSAGRAIDLLNRHNGLVIDIEISVGKRRDASLLRDTVLPLARLLSGRRDGEVRKVIVSGRENPGDSIEVLDLLEDRLVYEAMADFRGRRLDPRECERILLAAHEEHAAELENYPRRQ